MSQRHLSGGVHVPMDEDAVASGSDAEFELEVEGANTTSEGSNGDGLAEGSASDSDSDSNDDDDGDDDEGVHVVEFDVEDIAQLEAGTEGEEGEEEDGESDVEEEEEEETAPMTRHRLLSLLFGGSRERGRHAPRDMPKLPVAVEPLRGDLAIQINSDTRAYDVGQSNPIWACLDSGFDSSTVPMITTEQHRQLLHEQQQQQGWTAIKRQRTMQHQQQQQQQEHEQQQQHDVVHPENHSEGSGASRLASMLQSATAGFITRSAARRAAAAAPAGDEEMAAAAAAAEAGAGPSSSSRAAAAGPSSSSSSSDTGFTLVNTAQMLLKREVSLGRQTGFSRAQQRHLCCLRSFPLHPQKERDNLNSRAYIGQYSASGDFFIAAYQDRRVRLYDTLHGWRLRKDVTTRMTRWTITDTCLSPDQRLLVYASISPVAFVVNVGSPGDLVESQANITELHEPLALDGSAAAPGADNNRGGGGGGGFGSDDDEGGAWSRRDFGIWSIAWSPQGGQLIAGTNDRCVYVYDIESKRCLSRLSGHNDDVNAVAYLAGDTNPSVIVSGSDDGMVRVWDTRVRDVAGHNARKPQGVLVGHTEGLTHLCPKGDGYHLISNAKDQTVKLWDVRAALSPADASAAAQECPSIARWDYRWEDYPATGYEVKHPRDVSLMTYRGHSVLQTLVRAYFSPAHTTGQRYIYAGSADGVINAWDVVSGKTVAQFEHHRALVRDCSWHPYEPEMTSVSWDGTVVSWGVNPPGKPLAKGQRGDVGRYY